MYLKSTKQNNGRMNLSIVEGYRDPVTKKTKHKVIKNLGYVDRGDQGRAYQRGLHHQKRGIRPEKERGRSTK